MALVHNPSEPSGLAGMRDLYSFISAKILGRDSKSNASSQRGQPCPPFHLFPMLPAELRRKIWLHALPQRLVEASLDLDHGAWICANSKPIAGSAKPRRLPELFATTVESREICLEEYIPFAGTFVHPKLDLLHISWCQNGGPQPGGQELPLPLKSFPILDRPFSKLENVAITLNRNSRLPGRFEMLVTCIRDLGTPEELFLSLAGPNLPNIYHKESGFSITDGSTVSVLDWPQNTEQAIAEELTKPLRDAVVESFASEKAKTPDFEVPKINHTVYYMSSGQ